MQLLHSQQQWDLMRDHQAEMLQEAKNAHLARMAKQPQQKRGWSSLLRRQPQPSSLTLEPSVSSEAC